MTDKAFQPLSYEEDETPCHGCEERTEICHCICERYEKYVERRAKKNAAINKEKDKERVHHSYLIDNYRKRRWKK